MDLLYFVLFVSVLIFIHEAGHFAFAKIFGVKVLTFSVGFGPKLVKIRGRETEYCIGVLPFGGFVKMLEEGKSREAILPEDRHRTFESQKLWKRIVIVLAGPGMNVLFPILLYTSVFYEDREFLSPVVGSVLPGKPADGKLMPEDRIVSIDGHPVASFPEVQDLVATRQDEVVEAQQDRATPCDREGCPRDLSRPGTSRRLLDVVFGRQGEVVDHLTGEGRDHRAACSVGGGRERTDQRRSARTHDVTTISTRWNSLGSL